MKTIKKVVEVKFGTNLKDARKKAIIMAMESECDIEFELNKTKHLIKYEDIFDVSKFSENLRIAKLQHYYDSTQGLYCIDRNPKDVSYEWIVENNFRLTEGE